MVCTAKRHHPDCIARDGRIPCESVRFSSDRTVERPPLPRLSGSVCPHCPQDRLPQWCGHYRGVASECDRSTGQSVQRRSERSERSMGLMVETAWKALLDAGVLDAHGARHWVYVLLWPVQGRVWWYVGETGIKNPYDRRGWNTDVQEVDQYYSHLRERQLWPVTGAGAERIVDDALSAHWLKLRMNIAPTRCQTEAKLLPDIPTEEEAA